MQYPKFRNPEYTCDYKTKFKDAELFQYECYANIVWNVCETVHDRGEKDDELAQTWKPIVVAENKLHRKWFDDEKNHHKFKDLYIKYVKEDPELNNAEILKSDELN
jgi:hypothetical protein